MEKALVNYEIMDTIGSGSYGVVKKIRDRRTDKYYALKILSKK